MESYYYVSMTSGGMERVGDDEFEDRLVRIAKQCRGSLSGTGFDILSGQRDYGFIFKTEKMARRFKAALGRRAKAWKIHDRLITYWFPAEDGEYTAEDLD